jgi:hypothetical protein
MLDIATPHGRPPVMGYLIFAATAGRRDLVGKFSNNLQGVIQMIR